MSPQSAPPLAQSAPPLAQGAPPLAHGAPPLAQGALLLLRALLLLLRALLLLLRALLLLLTSPDINPRHHSARDSTQRTGKEGRRLRSALHLCVARQSCNSLSSHYLSSYLAFLSRSLITCCQAVGQRAESVLTLPQVLLHINDEVLDSKCTCHAYHTHAHT